MVEQILQQILEEVKGIKTEQVVTGQRLDRMEQLQEASNQRLDRMEQSTNARFDRMEQVQQAIFEQGVRNSEEIAEIKSTMAVKEDFIDIPYIKQAVLETNEAVKRMELVQEEQHRVIELLSTRSIEQEATLKRIK
jgi:hypothetical protein